MSFSKLSLINALENEVFQLKKVCSRVRNVGGVRVSLIDPRCYESIYRLISSAQQIKQDLLQKPVRYSYEHKRLLQMYNQVSFLESELFDLARQSLTNIAELSGQSSTRGIPTGYCKNGNRAFVHKTKRITIHSPQIEAPHNYFFEKVRSSSSSESLEEIEYISSYSSSETSLEPNGRFNKSPKNTYYKSSTRKVPFIDVRKSKRKPISSETTLVSNRKFKKSPKNIYYESSIRRIPIIDTRKSKLKSISSETTLEPKRRFNKSPKNTYYKSSTARRVPIIDVRKSKRKPNLKREKLKRELPRQTRRKRSDSPVKKGMKTIPVRNKLKYGNRKQGKFNIQKSQSSNFNLYSKKTPQQESQIYFVRRTREGSKNANEKKTKQPKREKYYVSRMKRLNTENKEKQENINMRQNKNSNNKYINNEYTNHYDSSTNSKTSIESDFIKIKWRRQPSKNNHKPKPDDNTFRPVHTTLVVNQANIPLVTSNYVVEHYKNHKYTSDEFPIEQFLLSKRKNRKQFVKANKNTVNNKIITGLNFEEFVLSDSDEFTNNNGNYKMGNSHYHIDHNIYPNTHQLYPFEPCDTTPTKRTTIFSIMHNGKQQYFRYPNKYKNDDPKSEVKTSFHGMLPVSKGKLFTSDSVIKDQQTIRDKSNMFSPHVIGKQTNTENPFIYNPTSQPMYTTLPIYSQKTHTKSAVRDNDNKKTSSIESNPDSVKQPIISGPKEQLSTEVTKMSPVFEQKINTSSHLNFDDEFGKGLLYNNEVEVSHQESNLKPSKKYGSKQINNSLHGIGKKSIFRKSTVSTKKPHMHNGKTSDFTNKIVSEDKTISALPDDENLVNHSKTHESGSKTATSKTNNAIHAQEKFNEKGKTENNASKIVDSKISKSDSALSKSSRDKQILHNKSQTYIQPFLNSDEDFHRRLATKESIPKASTVSQEKQNINKKNVSIHHEKNSFTKKDAETKVPTSSPHTKNKENKKKPVIPESKNKRCPTKSNQEPLNYSIHFTRERQKRADLGSMASTLSLTDFITPKCKPISFSEELHVSEHKFNGIETHNKFKKSVHRSEKFQNGPCYKNIKKSPDRKKLSHQTRSTGKVKNYDYCKQVSGTRSVQVISDCSSSLDWKKIAQEIKKYS